VQNFPRNNPSLHRKKLQKRKKKRQNIEKVEYKEKESKLIQAFGIDFI